ncbi:hypothetical protein KFK09_025774 [Dendrobium nobile]|uniref:Uncharacterized protein n=1 Tax=Dendrobium nobile TaxID=94219 RepID=A0A8T3A6C1_DENNO|nr:hypothetical protein KFK09_025774 [Dendrobium nobile]
MFIYLPFFGGPSLHRWLNPPLLATSFLPLPRCLITNPSLTHFLRPSTSLHLLIDHPMLHLILHGRRPRHRSS